MLEKRISAVRTLCCGFICVSALVSGFPFFHSRFRPQQRLNKIYNNNNNDLHYPDCYCSIATGATSSMIIKARRRRRRSTILFQAKKNAGFSNSKKKNLKRRKEKNERRKTTPSTSTTTLEKQEQDQDEQQQEPEQKTRTATAKQELKANTTEVPRVPPPPPPPPPSSLPPQTISTPPSSTTKMGGRQQEQKQKKKRKLHFKIRRNHKITTVSSDGSTSSTRSSSFATAAERDGDEYNKSFPKFRWKSVYLFEQSPKAKVVPTTGFNVVLTHCTADFDSLASAVGLAKLWSNEHHEKIADPNNNVNGNRRTSKDNNDDANEDQFDSSSMDVPTYVVLPRGAHPDVQRFLALHKYLFPITSLKSLPNDLSGLHRLGLVDAQRRDRIGPADKLLEYADRITVVDHHVDMESDIPHITDYVVDQVGSVSTLIAERLKDAALDLTEAEATLLALGIHCDTGSLCYDSTTPRDALALAWVMGQGASQTAIAEHAKSSLSSEQQNVLTQTLVNTNVTCIHGVSIGTVLLEADGFINGLAAVTQDALELSSSDIFLLSLVYEATSGRQRRSKRNKQDNNHQLGARLLSKLESRPTDPDSFAEAWKGGEEVLRRQRLKMAFDNMDKDNSGYIDHHEVASALANTRIIASKQSIKDLMKTMDTTGSSNNSTAAASNDKVFFDDFVKFADSIEKAQERIERNRKSWTMIIIGRVKAGVNMKSVKLNKLLEKNFGGGGHAKAASATIRLNNENEAEDVLQSLVDELIDTYLQQQSTVGDFMTAPVLSAKPNMNERQVEQLFTRYDVRALPVVDDNNDVIGLVTFKEVAAAKQRLWNKEQKRLKRELQLQKQLQQQKGEEKSKGEVEEKDKLAKSIAAAAARAALHDQRAISGSTVKGWMKQHIQTVEASKTMAEVEAILLENDIGCIPVVEDGTRKLVGMVTRTDLLRQHRYYPSLHYHNKGFSDSIAARQPIVELRKRLKKFDLENE